MWELLLSRETFAAIIGGVVVVLAEGVWRWWGQPVLRAEFINDHNAYKTFTVMGRKSGLPGGEVPASFLRIRVSNTRRETAKSCRAYLVRVEKLDETQIFRDTIYCDSTRLKWSALPEADKLLPMDLPCGVGQFIDLFSTNQKSTNYAPQLQVILNRYDELFREHGTFRFRVLITGDGAKPITIRVAFTWTGVWDQYTARKA